MGLLFVFPNSQENSDRFKRSSDKVTLKTYGLPYIFWFYALVILTLYSFLVLSIIDPIEKLLVIGKTLDKILVYSFIIFLILTPFVFLSFYFYEKQISSNGMNLEITDKVFYIPIRKKTINLTNGELEVRHFVDSPNMARIRDDITLRAFYNQGYYELIFRDEQSKKTILIDRSSQGKSLEKIKEILLLN